MGTGALENRYALDSCSMISFDNIREDTNRWGLSRALYLRVMVRLRRWLVVCRIHVRLLSNDPAYGDELEGDITVRLATREDLLRAAEELPDELTVEFIDASLRRGDLCVGAFDGSILVSFVWRAFTATPNEDGLAPHQDEIWVGFEKPYRYGYKSFTRPEYRGRHLQDPVARLSDRMCIERGYMYDINSVETHNYPSIASVKRHGHRLVGFAGYLMVWGRVYPFQSRGAKRHTFRFYKPSGRPE